MKNDLLKINASISLVRYKQDYPLPFQRDIIIKPMARNGSFIFFYQKKDKENLVLVPVQNDYAVTMTAQNPMANNLKDRGENSIVLMEIHDNRIEAREVGLVRIGRNEAIDYFVVERDLYSAPYALVGGKLEVIGLKFTPLIKELESSIKSVEKILRPKKRIEGVFERNEPLSPDYGKTLTGDTAIRVLEWNPMKGVGSGIDSEGKSILLELNQFKEPKDAILRVQKGMIVFSNEKLSLPRKGRYELRACLIGLPKQEPLR